MLPRDKYCIIGVGHTAFGKLPGRSTYDLTVEASRKALADAGIDKSVVDAVLCKFPTSRFEHLYSGKIAQRLGIVPRVTGVLDQLGASNISLIAYAAMCMEAGQCDVALVTFADNPRTGSRDAYEHGWGDDAAFGWFGVPSGYAMIAQRHMAQYGTTSRQLGAVAVACRKHGALTPHAQARQAITLEEHQASRFVVEPLRLYDCALVSDGGAAVVVTTVERARALGARKITRIAGFGQAHTPWDIQYRHDLLHTGAAESGRQAYAMAGMGPREIDVAQIYDCFTITAVMTLEAYGFCKPGEGGHFVEGGRIELGGELPMNTSGGLLSETGMPGMQLIIEGVRQLRGECGPRQVKGAETAMVSNQGGIRSTHATLILRGE